MLTIIRSGYLSSGNRVLLRQLDTHRWLASQSSLLVHGPFEEERRRLYQCQCHEIMTVIRHWSSPSCMVPLKFRVKKFTFVKSVQGHPLILPLQQHRDSQLYILARSSCRRRPRGPQSWQTLLRSCQAFRQQERRQNKYYEDVFPPTTLCTVLNTAQRIQQPDTVSKTARFVETWDIIDGQ